MKLGTVVDMLISSSKWYRPPRWMVRHCSVLYLPWISAGINNKTLQYFFRYLNVHSLI